MIGEIGEVIDIIKKNGDTNTVEDKELRKQLVEEIADVLMYYNNVLLCYGISEEELKEAYISKFGICCMRMQFHKQLLQWAKNYISIQGIVKTNIETI